MHSRYVGAVHSAVIPSEAPLTCILLLEVSLDVVSLEFGIYEIVLAGETGTIFVLLVGLCRRTPDQLDRRAQLHRAK